MVDAVKVIIGERNGVELDFNEELNLVPENIPFSHPSVTATDTKAAILETNGIAVAQRYAIVLQHNGSVGGNTFIGYDSLIPGDATPIICPINGALKEFTFSNNNSSADYTLELRKNSTVATPFHTVSKVNTKAFVETGIDEPFTAGDIIYIKYVDDGTNASDAVLVLFFLNDGV